MCVYMCMYVNVCVCVCVYGARVDLREDNCGCGSSPSTLFESGSCVLPSAHQAPLQGTKVADACSSINFVDAGDPNSGSQACKENDL